MRNTIFVLVLCACATVCLAEDSTAATTTTVDSEVTLPNESDDTVSCTDLTTRTACEDEDTCAWDADAGTCGAGNGGGGGIPTETDAPTTTSTEAGAGNGAGDECEPIKTEPTCNQNVDCAWENITLICQAIAGVGDDSTGSEGLCPDITSEPDCGTQSGCVWLSDSSSCETDNDENNGATCSAFDPVQRRCQQIDAKNDCVDFCTWDERGGSCSKDDAYDPNDCGDETTRQACNALAPGNDGVTGAGCEWVADDNDESSCSKVEEELGNGGSESTRCDSINNEDDCNAEGQTDDDAGGAGSALVNCEWIIVSESGGAVACFKFDDADDCEAAKDDSEEKACSWVEPTDDDDTVVADDGGGGDDLTNPGGEQQNCRDYDACAAITTGETDCEANFECIFKDSACRKFGPGDAVGCPAQEVEDDCTAFKGIGSVQTDDGADDGANPTGDDDDGSATPLCLWKEEDITLCKTADACAEKKTKNQCKPAGQLKCAWNEFSKTCADEELNEWLPCQASENGADQDACKAVTNDDGDTACMWSVRASATCIDFEYCVYNVEKDCTGADDAPGCWWDGRFCNVGVEPTYTSTTSATVTTTSSTTVTTLFRCTNGERMCASGDECIKPQYWCDAGTPDCEDGSDEADCTTVTNTEEPVDCGIGKFECADSNAGGSKCYLEAWACDGENDCTDGTDEENCKTTKQPVPKATTSTTVSATSATTTTTRTVTDTSTTEPDCKRSNDCVTMDEFYDASSRNPLYSTPAKCRACVQKRSVDKVCEDAPTVGCPGAIPPSNVVTQEQLDAAFKAKNLRVELPFGVPAADVEAVLFQELPTLACKGQPTTCLGMMSSGLVEVRLEPRDKSNFMAVVCYVTKISGIWVQLSDMKQQSLIGVNGKAIVVYNSVLVNVDAEDGPKVKDSAAGDDYDVNDFDPQLAVDNPGYYFPTFDGFKGILQTDLEKIALGFKMDASTYASTAELKTAVMVENAKRLVKDQMAAKNYIAPSAIGSTSDTEVQAVFADVLKLNTAGVPPSGVKAMLQEGNNQLMDVEAQRLASLPGSGKKHESAGAKKSGGGKTVGVVVLILIVIGVAGGFAMFIHKRKQATGPSHKKMSNYENGKGGGSETANPSFARGTPSWADPAVPFLSRSEAEAALTRGGQKAKSFVVRQADSTPEGYIITSTNGGKFANIQLKRQAGQLFYGPKPLGANLNEAILTLQNKVPIAPKGAPQYFLGQQVSGGGSVNIGSQGDDAAC